MRNVVKIKTKLTTHKAGHDQTPNQLLIPEEAIDINGNRINTTGEIWQLHDQTTNLQLNWSLVKGNKETVDSLKAYLFYIVETKAPQSTTGVFNSIKLAIKCLNNNPPIDITLLDLYTVFEEFKQKNCDWRFGYVKRWYKWCVQQEISGFSKEILDELKQLKIPGFQAGLAVLNRDPEKGPFSDSEFQIIRNSVKQKGGSLKTRTIIMLLMELGLRPKQISLLDKDDLTFYETKSGEKLFSLNVVRLKQRIKGKQERKTRRISNKLGINLLKIIKKNEMYYSHWNIKPEKPIFISFSENKDSAPVILLKDKKTKANLIPRRITTGMVRYNAIKFSKVNKLVSPITGNLLHTYPYRFRYTLATRLASQGAPRSILAEILDHSSLTSVDIYIKSSSNIIAHLNEALGKNSYYMETINLFKGDISSSSETNNESVVRGSLPTLKSVGGIGVCGANYLCKLYPPLSCYLCPKFTAWKDAPHEDVLKELETYVTGLAEKTGNASDRIPLQLKETIVAVKSLIGKIENKN